MAWFWCDVFSESWVGKNIYQFLDERKVPSLIISWFRESRPIILLAGFTRSQYPPILSNRQLPQPAGRKSIDLSSWSQLQTPSPIFRTTIGWWFESILSNELSKMIFDLCILRSLSNLLWQLRIFSPLQLFSDIKAWACQLFSCLYELPYRPQQHLY